MKKIPSEISPIPFLKNFKNLSTNFTSLKNKANKYLAEKDSEEQVQLAYSLSKEVLEHDEVNKIISELSKNGNDMLIDLQIRYIEFFRMRNNFSLAQHISKELEGLWGKSKINQGYKINSNNFIAIQDSITRGLKDLHEKTEKELKACQSFG